MQMIIIINANDYHWQNVAVSTTICIVYLI